MGSSRLCGSRHPGNMRITIYCPDRHILYDGSTADKTGVGGGVTARIRIAAALARRGHAVSMICNCPDESIYDRVRYVPLDRAREIDCDALVMNSSGGALDLTPLGALRVSARVRILALSSPAFPKGSDALDPDAIYVCSNFVRRRIRRNAGLERAKVFIAHCGVNRWNRPGFWNP